MAIEDELMSGQFGWTTVDGGKVNGKPTRNMMCELEDGGTLWIGQWATEGAKKDATFVGKTNAGLCISVHVKRPVELRGCTADNAAVEQLALHNMKKDIENAISSIFIILPCFMHALRLFVRVCTHLFAHHCVLPMEALQSVGLHY